MDRDIKGWKEDGGKIAAFSVFLLLFNPSLFIIPLGNSSILERKRRMMEREKERERDREREREARGDLIREIKCRSLKFVVLR